jgi:preprotein translocase subunit SecE
MGFFNYLRETRGELRHVTWPTRRQTMNYTIVVLLISIGTGIFLGLLDYVFGKGLQIFI